MRPGSARLRRRWPERRLALRDRLQRCLTGSDRGASRGWVPVTREAHHYRSIQSLAHTIGAEAAFIRRLDAGRKKRNIGGYEAAGRISDGEAAEMANLAAELRGRVVEWIRATRPDLLA